MQIKFEAKKLKEANEYVNLLEPKKIKNIQKNRKSSSFIKKIFNFLFR